MLQLQDVEIAETPEYRAALFAEQVFRKHMFQVRMEHGTFLSSALYPKTQMSELEYYALQAAMEDVLLFDQECEERFCERLPAGFAEEYAHTYVPSFMERYTDLTNELIQKVWQSCA